MWLVVPGTPQRPPGQTAGRCGLLSWARRKEHQDKLRVNVTCDPVHAAKTTRTTCGYVWLVAPGTPQRPPGQAAGKCDLLSCARRKVHQDKLRVGVAVRVWLNKLRVGVAVLSCERRKVHQDKLQVSVTCYPVHAAKSTGTSCG